MNSCASPAENNSWTELRKQAASELLRRRRATERLIDFTTYTFPTYIAEPAHHLIADTLDRVVSGEIKRLMVFAPRQHGKSELASVRFPAYWVGRRPNDPVILSTYGASLAESKSRQARQIVEGDSFQTVFPDTTIRRDSRSVSHWELSSQRGGLLAAGVDGPVTGHGGMLGLIDDPVENWQDAMSKTVRDSCWEWYRTTFRPCIWEGGAIIIIMTRWHVDDLAGRLLKEQGDEWTVLRLPAVAETDAERVFNDRILGLKPSPCDPLGRQPGEPLCPQRFSVEALRQLKRDVGPTAWNGQYQGSPRQQEGNRLKREWFALVDEVPADASRCRAWDKAATQGDGDYTAGVLVARTKDGVYWIEDVQRGQWSVGKRDEEIVRIAKADNAKYPGRIHTRGEQEPGSAGKESGLAFVRMLDGFGVSLDKVTGSKEVRLEPFASQAEAGNVRMLKANWNDAFIDEALSFPNGSFDDQIDGVSSAYNYLAPTGHMPSFMVALQQAPAKPGIDTFNPGYAGVEYLRPFECWAAQVGGKWVRDLKSAHEGAYIQNVWARRHGASEPNKIAAEISPERMSELEAMV